MTDVATRTHAKTAIDVHPWEMSAYQAPAQGPALNRLHVAEDFSGDIAGTVTAEFLQAYRADGSASFVGIERVDGSVDGRTGTFLLQDAGTLEDDVISGDWFVIPGSGTGDLSGLRGTGTFRATGGKGEGSLDYWFE